MRQIIKRIFDKSNTSESGVVNNKDFDFATKEKPDIIIPPFIKDTKTVTLEEALILFRPDFIPAQRRIDEETLKKYILYAVALGDISGSKYEGCPYPGLSVSEIFAYNKCDGGARPIYDGYKTIGLFTPEHHFTDDTVLTIAVYKATQEIKTENITDENEIIRIYTDCLQKYRDLYPDAGYAAGFEKWAMSWTRERNFSYGNGSCMRVGGIAALFDNVEDVIRYAYYSAVPSHSHAEGIKGAVCTAVIYWMLAFGASKDDVLKYIQKQYPADNGQNINSATTMDDLINMNMINPWSTLSVVCQTSLVEAAINFLESNSFESCLRNSYRYLCDRDTISAIAAPMAAIYYKDISVNGWPGEEIVKRYLDERLLNAAEN